MDTGRGRILAAIKEEAGHMTWLELQRFRIRINAVFGCGPANHGLENFGDSL